MACLLDGHLFLSLSLSSPCSVNSRSVYRSTHVQTIVMRIPNDGVQGRGEGTVPFLQFSSTLGPSRARRSRILIQTARGPVARCGHCAHCF
ncbi:hypothetical protein F5Y10DRAFT_25597 [Nemania abortiva]|nr:hypothetical protein F5Y10DRAFT_25597 [Nemania abortiva]